MWRSVTDRRQVGGPPRILLWIAEHAPERLDEDPHLRRYEPAVRVYGEDATLSKRPVEQHGLKPSGALGEQEAGDDAERPAGTNRFD
jgi:hypothetical protein